MKSLSEKNNCQGKTPTKPLSRRHLPVWQSVAQLKRKRTENPSQRDPSKSRLQGLRLGIAWHYTIWIRIKTRSNLTAIKAVQDTHHTIHSMPVIAHFIPHCLSFLVCKIQSLITWKWLFLEEGNTSFQIHISPMPPEQRNDSKSLWKQKPAVMTPARPSRLFIWAERLPPVRIP